MPVLATVAASGRILGPRVRDRVSENGFPSFLPKEVESIRDPAARELAKRIERLPVKVRFLVPNASRFWSYFLFLQDFS